MSAVPSEPPCTICGGPMPTYRRQGPRPIVCCVECSEERNRRYSKAYTAAIRADLISPRQRPHNGGRAGTLRARALLRAVQRGRETDGELAGVEWSPGDCPRLRGDAGPCIHVACRWHLCCEVGADGSIWVDPRFTDDPYSVATCAIDAAMAHPDGLTLEKVGAIFEVCRERVRQIEAKAVRKLWDGCMDHDGG